MFNHEELFTVALQLRNPFIVTSKDFNHNYIGEFDPPISTFITEQ